MTRNEYERLIHTFYESRLANDADACLAHFSPTASFRLIGTPLPPGGAPPPSPDAVRRQVHDMVHTWEWKAFDLQSIAIDGDRAAVYYRLTTAFKPTRDILTTDVVDLMTFANGKVTSFIEFVDTALVERFMRTVPAYMAAPPFREA
jgi:ketosteroid isomerase-like protein